MGENQWVGLRDQGSQKLSLSQIADELGISEKNLRRSLSIERNLTESMKELLDAGVIGKTLAVDCIATMTPEEQEELISQLDVIDKGLSALNYIYYSIIINVFI